MTTSTRRNFFYSAGAALTAAQATRVLGANDRIQVAIIGLGGMTLTCKNDPEANQMLRCPSCRAPFTNREKV